MARHHHPGVAIGTAVADRTIAVDDGDVITRLARVMSAAKPDCAGTEDDEGRAQC